MQYDFDQWIDRSGTNSVKWEFYEKQGDLIHWDRTKSELGEQQVLPMWVADMDFPCPQPVVEALIRRAQHPMYGYSDKTDS